MTQEEFLVCPQCGAALFHVKGVPTAREGVYTNSLVPLTEQTDSTQCAGCKVPLVRRVGVVGSAS